jgi:membrane-associated protein
MHLDKELVSIVAKYGTATYAILFGIVFAETGLVVTPFLPGPLRVGVGRESGGCVGVGAWVWALESVGVGVGGWVWVGG